MLVSFLVFLSLFALIGISSVVHSRRSHHDYYLASSDVAPSLVGLSAVATNNSGYMFIGVIGYTYTTGLAAIWIMIGWILGDLIASTFIHKSLRRATQRTGEISYAGVLSHWNGGNNIWLKRLIAVISVMFLLAYASAQLMAGSKALSVLFGWQMWAGAALGAVMVAAYCMAGGIRASIWTDAAQSVVMISAMGLLLLVALYSIGGSEAAVDKMSQVSGFLDLFPTDLAIPGLLGGLLFAIGWGFAGFSVIGQPHVMVRFMALNDEGNIRRARYWYYIWFTAFYLMATGVGLLSRILLPDTTGFDAELALPTMALQLLPSVLVGLILAGIFAATISTADSLILSCSAALTQDLLPASRQSMWLVKLATLLITLAALGLALMNNQTVFQLVILSWSSLASAFAPLLVILALGGRPSQPLSIAAMIVGLAVALIWRELGWHNAVYEGTAGILAGLLVLAPSLIRR